jgi:hypothetical protein
MTCCFAIIPEDALFNPASQPVALFETIEDAMDWGLQRYKGGTFRVRYQPMMAVEVGNGESMQR